MTWNPEARQYEDAYGNAIPPAQVREWIDSFIANSQSEIDDESDNLLSGAITTAAFFAFLGSLITSMHIASSLIACGGEDEMNSTCWSRLDQKLSSELAYLEAFREKVVEAEIVTESLASFVTNTTAPGRAGVSEAVASAIRAEGRADIAATVGSALESVGVTESGIEVGAVIDSFGARIQDIIWGEVNGRAVSYPHAAYSTYENSVKSRETDAGAIGVAYVCENDESSCEDCPTFDTNGEYVSMEEVTDIGAGACGVRCRCSYLFQYLNVEPLEIDREIYA